MYFGPLGVEAVSDAAALGAVLTPPFGTGCASRPQASSTSSAGLRWTATCEPFT